MGCGWFKTRELQSIKRLLDPDTVSAFKLSNIDSETCPIHDEIGGEGHVIGRSYTDFYSNYTVTYFGGSWNFKYSPSFICEIPYAKMFKRSKGAWCLDFWQATVGYSRDEREMVCMIRNSTLSGLDTVEEFEHVKEVSRVAGLFNLTNLDPPLSGVWIGGIRNRNVLGIRVVKGLLYAFNFQDPLLSENPTGFLWNSNQPNGTSADCLIWRINRDGTSGIDDVECSLKQDGQTLFRGFICGKVPVQRP
ncbi:unnamed protein product [Caenorhabditis nigoni]